VVSVGTIRFWAFEWSESAKMKVKARTIFFIVLVDLSDFNASEIRNFLVLDKSLPKFLKGN
jgi:hypothetical protein